MDNKKLAQLIYSVAQYEGYNTSVLQTQKNLSTHKEEWSFSTESDRYIFEDLLKAIQYASVQEKVTVEVVKGINAQNPLGSLEKMFQFTLATMSPLRQSRKIC